MLLPMSILLGSAYAAPPFFPHSAATPTSSPMGRHSVCMDEDIPCPTATTMMPDDSANTAGPCSWVSGRPMQTCFAWSKPSGISSGHINGTMPTPSFRLVLNTFTVTSTAGNGSVFTIEPDHNAGNFITVTGDDARARVGAFTLPAGTPTSNSVRNTAVITGTAGDGVVFTITPDANGDYVITESKERFFHKMTENISGLHVGRPTPSPGAANGEGKWTVFDYGVTSTLVRRVSKKDRS